MLSREELEEAFKLLDEGKTSFRDLESKLGVPKSTLHKWYLKRLERRIEERRRELADLEQKVSKLQMEFNTLKERYEQQHRALTEEYRKRRAELEGEIERLRRDSEAIRAAFERQGISWDEGVAIVVNVASLKEENEKLRAENEKLRAEASRLQLLNKELKDYYEVLYREVVRIQSIYNSWVYWRQNELPKLEKAKSQLQQSIKALEDQKLKLTEEIDELQRAKAQLQASLNALKDEMVRTMREIDKRKSEIDEYKREVEDYAQRITADAEEKRRRILQEVESLRREVEKLRAERDFLEHAIRNVLKQSQRLRREQEVVPQSRKTPLEGLLERLPILEPLEG
ncbi:MAG: hypothetical protein QW706_07435 [Candidatus Nezhaarchaeales archaeon]